MKPLAALLLVLALTLGGCSGTAGRTSSGVPGSGKVPIQVVTSTDVYADIVKAVGGDAVTVRSLIDSPAKDPHEYEGDAQSQLALSNASLVVENGGGYDDFVETMIASLDDRPRVLDVADLSGYDQDPASGDFNEHLWYDFPTMVRLTDRLRAELSAAAPTRAATFTANAKAFTAQLKKLERRESSIAEEHAGESVAVTEPVPLYLLGAVGLENLTPAGFSQAVENGADVAPSVLRQTTNLLDRHQVRLLVYNEQTGGPQTEAVLAAARRNGIAVLPVTETLPPGTTYLSWMRGYLTAIADALEV